MNLLLELTLEDCKNLLEAEAANTSAIMLAATHNMNPFDRIPDERIREYHKTWAKIKVFVEEKENVGEK